MKLASLPTTLKASSALNLHLTSLQAFVFRCPSPVPVRTSFGIMRDRPAVFVRAEGTWGINFPLVINDLRPQKTTSSKEVAQCQAQDLAKSLV
jgi:hypothetical protein